MATSTPRLDGNFDVNGGLPDWTFGNSATQTNNLDDPLSQFMDMDTIRQFNAELAGLGISPDMMGWQHALHQPPW